MEEDPNDFLCFEVDEVEGDHPHQDSFPAKSNESTVADRLVYPLNSNFNSNSNSGPCPYNDAGLKIGDDCLKRQQAPRVAEENVPLQISDDTLGTHAETRNVLATGPIKLNLGESRSLEKLIETTVFGRPNASRQQALVQPTTKQDPPSLSHPQFEKMKAANFPALLLRIGSYTKVAQNESGLVCKCYYAKQKLVWEILDLSLKKKIEIEWSNIVGLRARTKENNVETLEIELNKPPVFYLEIDPKPRKHSIWNLSSDFTGGEASTFRRHYLEFRPGVLRRQYEKLVQYDGRLSELSRRDYPSLSNPYFDHILVPPYLHQVANMSEFNGGGTRFNPSLQPRINRQRSIIRSHSQQFHPYRHPVSSPYDFNNSTLPNSGTQPGNGFHHPGITDPNSHVWPEEMIPVSESPLEAYSSSLSESAAVQLQYYNNLMAHSDERIDQISSFPSLSQYIASDAVIGTQFPSADNVMVDGSQMVRMVDPSLLSRSSEAHTVNMYQDTVLTYTPQISFPATPSPIQDASGNLITSPANNNFGQYVSEDASSMINGDTYRTTMQMFKGC